MSNVTNNLEVFPPALTPVTKKGEMFTSGGHQCPYCNGLGYTTPKQTWRNEWEDNTCPVCKGSGKLKANIVIGWEAEV